MSLDFVRNQLGNDIDQYISLDTALENTNQPDHELRLDYQGGLNGSVTTRTNRSSTNSWGSYIRSLFGRSDIGTRRETALAIRNDLCAIFSSHSEIKPEMVGKKFDEVFGGSFCFFHRPPMTKSKLENFIKSLAIKPNEQKDLPYDNVSRTMFPYQESVHTPTETENKLLKNFQSTFSKKDNLSEKDVSN